MERASLYWDRAQIDVMQMKWVNKDTCYRMKRTNIEREIKHEPNARSPMHENFFGLQEPGQFCATHNEI